MSTGMPLPSPTASPVSNGTLFGLAKGKEYCSSVLPAFQLHARSVVSDCLLRFYAVVSREHPVKQSALDFAISQAAAPDVDDFDSFKSWCSKQKSCGFAVACAVARILRLLQAAGDCPGLRETLEAAASCDRGTAAPLHSLLDGVRAHSRKE